MQKDAHYYAILAFSRNCGFTKQSAHKVAYASQFVDDAKTNQYVLQGPTDGLEDIELIDGNPSLYNFATCHAYNKIDTFNYSAMINNTCAFHFVPYCSGHSFVRKLRCGEESSSGKKSPVIESIMEEAIEEGDVIRFGLVLHPYADTFSHQGFSGLLSKVNDICEVRAESFSLPIKFSRSIVSLVKSFTFSQSKFDKRLDKILPAYGHAQAWDYPDIPCLKWSYKYDYSDEFSRDWIRLNVNNPKRFRRAFNNIKDELTQFLSLHPNHKDEKVIQIDFEILFQALLKSGYLWWRIRNWKNVMIDNGLFDENDSEILEYNEELWNKQAFRNYNKKHFNHRKVAPAIVDESFTFSDLYQYYRSVKWYKKRFHYYCGQYGLDISM
jgi:hypothetical protein